MRLDARLIILLCELLTLIEFDVLRVATAVGQFVLELLD